LSDVLANVGDEFGVDRVGLDDAHPHVLAEHLLADRFGEGDDA
jgi:hypothetical protein